MTRTVTPSIETYRGFYVDLIDPQWFDVDLSDIARALSMTCRFGGHVDRFYSVAEHAVRTAALVAQERPDLALAALHHDSHEAYIGDIPTPIKRLLDQELLSTLAGRFDAAICQACGLNPDNLHHSAIKAADFAMLLAEASTLKPSRGVGVHWGNDAAAPPLLAAGWPPTKAERLFLDAHRDYYKNGAAA